MSEFGIDQDEFDMIADKHDVDANYPDSWAVEYFGDGEYDYRGPFDTREEANAFMSDIVEVSGKCGNYSAIPYLIAYARYASHHKLFGIK